MIVLCLITVLVVVVVIVIYCKKRNVIRTRENFYKICYENPSDISSNVNNSHSSNLNMDDTSMEMEMDDLL